MESINDVLKLLNQIELFNILRCIDYNTFNDIRKILLDEFNDEDLDKLIEMVGIVDDLCIDYLRNKIYFDKSLITTLRNKIYYLYNQKKLKIIDNA